MPTKTQSKAQHPKIWDSLIKHTHAMCCGGEHVPLRFNSYPACDFFVSYHFELSRATIVLMSTMALSVFRLPDPLIYDAKLWRLNRVGEQPIFLSFPRECECINTFGQRIKPFAIELWYLSCSK